MIISHGRFDKASALAGGEMLDLLARHVDNNANGKNLSMTHHGLNPATLDLEAPCLNH